MRRRHEPVLVRPGSGRRLAAAQAAGPWACPVVLLLAGLLICDTAVADEGGGDAAVADEGEAAAVGNDQYSALIADAVTEFGSGHWKEARALFVRAHQLSPNARTLRGLGMVEFELRHYTTSADYLRAALESDAHALTGELRNTTQQLLDRARAFLGTFGVVLVPADARIRVDGREVASGADGTLFLELGEHTIEASADGYLTLRREVEVVGGEHQYLEFRLEPVSPEPTATPLPIVAPAEPPPSVPPPEPQPSPLAAVEVDDGSGVNLPAWLLAGGGGAMVAAGLTVGLFALGAEDDFREACPVRRETCEPSTESKQSRAQDLALVSDVLWIGGAAVASAGLLWLVLDAIGPDRSTHANVIVSPDGGGLVVHGAF